MVVIRNGKSWVQTKTYFIRNPEGWDPAICFFIDRLCDCDAAQVWKSLY